MLQVESRRMRTKGPRYAYSIDLHMRQTLLPTQGLGGRSAMRYWDQKLAAATAQSIAGCSSSPMPRVSMERASLSRGVNPWFIRDMVES